VSGHRPVSGGDAKDLATTISQALALPALHARKTRNSNVQISMVADIRIAAMMLLTVLSPPQKSSGVFLDDGLDHFR
jgi:hypothetical protein